MDVAPETCPVWTAAAASPTSGPWLVTAGAPADLRAGARASWSAGGSAEAHDAPLAVLFDRDGTLVEDVPYNTDPDLVRPLPQAHAALAELRAHGVATGVVSNQSGLGLGLCSPAAAEAVRRRVDELLGPFDVWAICPHAPDAGCGCRKPAPGLVRTACAALGAPPERTVVIGDIGSDLAAAEAAGARGVLVPARSTQAVEVAAAESAGARAPDLLTAVRALLGTAGPPARRAPDGVPDPAADGPAARHDTDRRETRPATGRDAGRPEGRRT